MPNPDEQGESFEALQLGYARRGGAIPSTRSPGRKAAVLGAIACGIILTDYALQWVPHFNGIVPLMLLMLLAAFVMYAVSLAMTIAASFAKPRESLRLAWILVLLQSAYWAWIAYGIVDLFRHPQGLEYW